MHMVSALLIISASILSTFASNCSDKNKRRDALPLAQSLPVMVEERITKEEVFGTAAWITKTSNEISIGDMKKIVGKIKGIDPRFVVILPEPNNFKFISTPAFLTVKDFKKRNISVFSVYIVDRAKS